VPATDRRFELAESPVWDAARERLLWVDIDAGLLLEGRLDDGSVTVTGSRSFDDAVTAVVPAADGSLAVAVGRGVVELLPDGRVGRSAEVVAPGRRSRLNDATADPEGRLLIGSKALDGRTGDEVLVRVDDGGVTTIDDDLTLSNGLAWSPGASALYSVDSIPGTVWVRDRDARGDLGSRRELLRIADGVPDGICVDADGALWVAIWGRGEIRRYLGDGTIDVTVLVDAPHTSSVAFAGSGLDVLVITTARADLDADGLAAAPGSGRLYLADPGVRGLAVPAWSPGCFPGPAAAPSPHPSPHEEQS
jgi:sugar lactone lactonase YvrE